MASAGGSTGVSRGEEMTKGMMQIVQLMLKARDREALIDKAIDQTVQITCRFDGKNITKFLAMYRNEMQQRDVQDQTQIASFKRVVEPQVSEGIIEIQNAQPTWAEFEKALLAQYMLDDASRMTRHALISWIEKKGKNLSVSGVYTEYDRM
jgi:hypothetical protein